MKLALFKARSAFTLAELLVTAGVTVLLGSVLFAFGNATLTLYVKNYSINESHFRGRNITEKLAHFIHRAVEPPLLIDKSAAGTTGNGPANGISILSYEPKFYYTSNAIGMNTKTIQVNQIGSDQPVPSAGDHISIQWYDAGSGNSGSLYAQIAQVDISGGGKNAKLTFANDIGSYLEPVPKSGAVIKPNQPFQLLTRCALIAVPVSNQVSELRFYPSAPATQAEVGSKSYRVLSEIVPAAGETECTPFRYTDMERRSVEVDLRTVASRYDKRTGSGFNLHDSIHTSLAFRSALQKALQP
jgi:hypothetical protein